MMHRVPSASATLAAIASMAMSACVVACGPRPEHEGARAPRSVLPHGGKAVDPGAPAVPWSRKSRAERIEFMGLVFYPRMKALFPGETSAPSGAENNEAPLRCQTCHGEDMVAVDYRMPNGLFPLPAHAPLESALAHDEKTARLMADRVVPLLRELIDSETASAADAPGCHACHAKE